MLRGNYKKYEDLYIYGFKNSHPALREFDEEDLIGYWEEDGIGVLFFHKEKDDLVNELIKCYNLELDIKQKVKYSEWNEKRIPKPFEVGPFKIAPLWYEGTWDIVFDPSVVFGEGTHPTTSLMLENSWEFFKSFGQPQTVLDIGCGSGILTLFWSKLGSKVMAVDINPLCIKVTKHNLYINRLHAEVVESDIKKLLPFKVELVLGNLYKGLLLDLFGLPSFWTSKYYLVSGFVVSMEEELKQALTPFPCKVIWRKEKDGWVCWLIENASNC